MTTTITLTTPSGKRIEITGASDDPHPTLRATMPEVNVRGTIRNATAYPLETPRDGATHQIVIDGGISVNVGLDSEQAQRLTEFIAAIPESDETRKDRLHAERRSLVGKISDAIANYEDEQNSRWERGDERGTFEVSEEPERLAREALAAFDAEHPEIREQVEAENKRRADAALWR